MPLAPALFAVVTHRIATLPAKRKNIVELRSEKLSELQAKKNIDRAAELLDRLEARAASCGKQIAALQKRKAAACCRAERLEDRILTGMVAAHLDRVDGFRVQFLARPAPLALQVDDESLIPAGYMRDKTSSSPDKIAIKAALAKGEDVAGVRLTQKLSLVRK